MRTLAAHGRGGARARASPARASSRPALRARLPDLDHLDDPAWLRAVRAHVAGSRPRQDDGRPGALRRSRASTVAQALVERGIVIEKAGVNTLTLITTFQLGPSAVADTVARSRRSSPGASCPTARRRRAPANPFAALDDRPVMHPYHARRYAKSIGHEVPIEEAVGQRRRRDRRGLSARHPA